MLYQKDPKYAHLPHSEWLKTPDGERYRQALAQYGGAGGLSEGRDMSPSRPEDRIRDLMGRRPVSHGKGPPPDKPPKPEPPKSQCYPRCNPDGSMPVAQDMMCRRTPDPNCQKVRPRPTDLPGGNWPGAPWVAALQPNRDPGMDKTKPGWSAGMTQYQR